VETEAGVIKGKLRYMPPEQIAGEDVDRRVDVFAVGVMLWEALSGSKLWKGLPDATIMNRVLAGQIPKPQHATQSIPAELEAICMRALAAERDERYRSALDFELALEEYLSKRSHYVSAREISKFMCERFAEARRSVEQRIEAELVRGDAVAPAAPLGPSHGNTPSHAAYSSPSIEQAAPQRSRLWIVAMLLLSVGIIILLVGLQSRPDGSSGGGAPAASMLATPEPVAASPNASPAPPSEPPLASTSPPVSAMPSQQPKTGSSRPRPAPSGSSHPSGSCDPPYYLDERGIKKFKRECL
jgi:eukaryotic-like serine/threonine-protein kinase